VQSRDTVIVVYFRPFWTKLSLLELSILSILWHESSSRILPTKICPVETLEPKLMIEDDSDPEIPNHPQLACPNGDLRL